MDLWISSETSIPGNTSHFVINALKKIEIEQMSISKFMGLPELLSIQYLTNISPLTLPSPLPSPKRLRAGRPKGRGEVRGPFHGCHGK